jgi:hypothetical protein
MSTTFVKTGLPDFAVQLQNFATKLPNYKTVLDITTAELAEVAADASYMTWIKDNYTSVDDYNQKWTALKNQMRNGVGGAVANIPTALAISTAPTLVSPNIQLRFSNIVARAKKHKNYTEIIGQDLGIVATTAIVDLQNGKPNFYITLTSGGHPTLVWKKGNYEGVEIYKDAGDGSGYKKIDKDFRPDFMDKTDLPAAGTSAVWKYKMIYIFKDEHVGIWSDEVSILVAGTV